MKKKVIGRVPFITAHNINMTTKMPRLFPGMPVVVQDTSRDDLNGSKGVALAQATMGRFFVRRLSTDPLGITKKQTIKDSFFLFSIS